MPDDAGVRDQPVGDGGYPVLCDGTPHTGTSGVDGHHGDFRRT